MSSMPPVKTAKINGLKLAYHEWGNPGNPVLICLHSGIVEGVCRVCLD